MKNRSNNYFSSGRLAIAVLSSCFMLQMACAGNLYWDPGLTLTQTGGGTGTWDLATANWYNSSEIAWPNVSANDDKALFGATAGTVTLNSSLTAGGLQFDTSGYTLSGALDLTLSPQVTGSDALVVSSGVSNISISLRKLILTAANSGAVGDLVSTDKVNFGSTIVAFSGSRQMTLSNSTTTDTTTFTNFAVGSGSPGGASLYLNQGNLTITNFAASTSTSALAAANTTSTSAGIAFRGSGSGKLALSGNNTLLNNAGTGTLGINFLNANATYEIGHDNALGARDAVSALTDTFVEFGSGTLVAINGARIIENKINHTNTFAIGGANAVTLSGIYTQSGGNRTLNVNNSALTTLSGPVYLANDDVTARTMTIGGTGNATISGAITNNASTNQLASSLTKSGSGTLTLGGTNTFTGNTTVNSGSSLTLATAGSLKFAIKPIAVPTDTNKITGAGSATLNGTFNVDVSGAGTPASGSVWTLVDTAKTFGASFAVAGFTETPAASGLWVSGSWYFSELSGKLGYGTPPDHFWDGDSGGAWSVGGNWTSGSAPISGDTLVFTGSNTTNNNDLNTDTLGTFPGDIVALGGIIFGPGAGSFDLNGNTVNLAGKAITNYSANAQTLSCDIEADTGFTVNTSAGDVTLTGSLKTTAGFNKPLNKNGTGTLVLNGTQNTSWSFNVNAGTLQVFNTGAPAFSATIASGATLKAESGDVLHFTLGLQNSGTFDIGGNGEAFGNLQGSGVVTNHGSSSAVTSLLELGRGNSSFSGSIQDGPSVSPTAIRIFEVSPGDIDNYTHTLSGNNTYTGNTTIDQADQSFALTSTGSLKFKIGANGVNNKITGGAQTLGTVTLDGTFNIDLTGAAIANGNTWQVIAADLLPTTTFGGSFNIPGFTEASNVWIKVAGSNTWTFTEGTGVLSLAVSVATNYFTWASANGIPGQPASGDFDNDGLSNLVEYALGKNPTTSSTPAGTLASGTVIYTKGADAIANGDVSWVIEQSINLSTWSPMVTQAAGSASPTISYTLPTGQSKVFTRLKVVN
jgi:fibronectin-binding autotransporter adhesin